MESETESKFIEINWKKTTSIDQIKSLLNISLNIRRIYVYILL